MFVFSLRDIRPIHDPAQNEVAKQLADSLMPAMGQLQKLSLENARCLIILQAYLTEKDQGFIKEFDNLRDIFNHYQNERGCTQLVTSDLQDALFQTGLTDVVPDPFTDWQQPKTLSQEERFFQRYVNSLNPEIFDRFEINEFAKFLEFHRSIYLAVMTNNDFIDRDFGLVEFMRNELNQYQTPANWLLFATQTTHQHFKRQFIEQCNVREIDKFSHSIFGPARGEHSADK